MNAPARPDFVQAAARGALALPSVPRVVRRLIAELQNDDVDIASLVRELEQDPQLAARTLRIANSPYYCGRRSLASLNDAVTVIGTRALRTLVISCGLQAVFVEVPGVHLRRFWTDAGVAGQAARVLARGMGLEPESAFLAGLLHGVGHLILARAFAQALPAALVGLDAPRGAQLADVERFVCGFDHALVGSLWLDELGFPARVVEAVAQQLGPEAPAWLRGALYLVVAIDDGASGPDMLDGLEGLGLPLAARQAVATQLSMIAEGLS